MRPLFIFIFSITLCAASNAHSSDTSRSQSIPKDCLKPEVYTFGSKIQKAVKEKDLSALYSLVKGELSHGPRRAFVKGKTFDEVFPEEWRQALLKEEPPCSGSWRGYVIRWDKGDVWYYADDDGGYITSIGGVPTEFPEDSIKNEWLYQGDVLSGWCFTIIGYFQDNYEDLHEEFAKHEEPHEFYRFIGKYLGKEVPLQHEEWLSQNINKCVERVRPSTEGTTFQEYQVLKKISPKHCESLAPNIKQSCQVGLLVKIFESGGGSLIRRKTGLYGIFNPSKKRNAYVAPLINFKNPNDALNFLDDQGIRYEAP